jgi:tetratricopeptide (TPR) repeat protein
MTELWCGHRWHVGANVKRRGRTLLAILALFMCMRPGAVELGLADSHEAAPELPFSTMRDAVQEALHLRFAQAHDAVSRAEPDDRETLETQLTRGIIAYLQTHWQTRQRPPAHVTARKLFTQILQEGQRQLAESPRQGRLQLMVGLAAVFDALLPQQEAPWAPLQLAAQGRYWLEKSLLSDEAVSDAHLGLGMLYFVGDSVPSLVQRLLGGTALQGPEDAIHHFRRAAEAGRFSQDLARTFLLQLYVMEKRYREAIPLGQSLHQAYPENGHFSLLTGRSQFEHGDKAQAATTLGALATTLSERPETLVGADDRFDLYYTWGRALLDDQPELAFEAFRGAINNDPRTARDESLWAKFYLATLYEQRGSVETARQLYCTLLRERDVDNLHSQAEHRLSRLGPRGCG